MGPLYLPVSYREIYPSKTATVPKIDTKKASTQDTAFFPSVSPENMNIWTGFFLLLDSFGRLAQGFVTSTLAQDFLRTKSDTQTDLIPRYGAKS